MWHVPQPFARKLLSGQAGMFGCPQKQSGSMLRALVPQPPSFLGPRTRILIYMLGIQVMPGGPPIRWVSCSPIHGGSMIYMGTILNFAVIFMRTLGGIQANL